MDGIFIWVSNRLSSLHMNIPKTNPMSVSDFWNCFSDRIQTVFIIIHSQRGNNDTFI